VLKSVILSVKNLIISFRTNNGTVKAVRDVSFDLKKGETLAIVGESGSGKSVTVRAIIGILAGNAVVEGGEIIYDGKDLMKIEEDDFHHIRGNRISMIFQDPLSALNPVIRVGKQLTEAMILNGRASQREAKKEYFTRIDLLVEAMKNAYADAYPGSLTPEEINSSVKLLKKFVAVGNRYEDEYNECYGNAETSLNAINHALIDIINGEPKKVAKDIERGAKSASKVYNPFFIQKDGGLPGLLLALKENNAVYKKIGKKEELRETLLKVKELLETAQKNPRPNFFSLGYYCFKNQTGELNVSGGSVSELDAKTEKTLDEEFLSNFVKGVEAGIKHSYDKSIENKQKAIAVLDGASATVNADKFSYPELKKLSSDTTLAVENAIDRLDISKDSYAYTFGANFQNAIKTFISAKKEEEKKARRNQAGLNPNPNIALYRHNLSLTLQRVKESFIKEVEKSKTADFTAYGESLISHLQREASKMVYRVTKSIAKDRAISLMEEVGIPEPRSRYRQFPFQFSGGMRQRVVIAIALSANPDILICDEPTTALDVTIQAQILDLINGLKKERQLTVIFITHDLGVVANMADRIAVMYAGKIVEYGETEEVFYAPAHPYTWALLSSMPDLDTKEKLEAIPGTPPDMIFPPKGDAFAQRNKYALKIDFEKEPPFFDITATHKAATWLLHPNAPKVNPPKIVTERIDRMKKMGGISNV